MTWSKGPRHCTIYRVPGNEGSNWRLLMERGARFEKLGRVRVPRKLRGPMANRSPMEEVDYRCKMTPLHLFWGDLVCWGERMLFLYRPRHGFVYAHQLFEGSTLTLRERLDRLCEILAQEDGFEGRYDPEEGALVQLVTDADARRALEFFGIENSIPV